MRKIVMNLFVLFVASCAKAQTPMAGQTSQLLRFNRS